jgi:zinc protease
MKTLVLVLVLAPLLGCARVPPGPPTVPAALAPQAAKSPAGAPAPPTAPDLSYWQNRKDLISAPAPPPARPLELPPIERWKMASGLEVMVVPRKDPPVVTVAMSVRAGLYDEERRTLGVASFTAEMLRKGTRRRTADQIAEAIDAAGGSLTTAAASERSGIECTVLSKDAELCLDLLADMLLEPTFPEQEMGEVRDGLVGSIKQRYDDPRLLAEAHFDNLLFGDDHPDGWVPMPEDIERVTRADLQGFWRAYYRPNNSLLVVAGDVDVAGLRRSLDRRLGGWKGAPVPPRREPVIPPRHGKRFVLVDKDDLTQSTLLFGHPGIKHSDPDWYAATMVNYVLGGSDFSSRLMVEVRARRGLTYGISSSYGASLYQGAFEVEAATRNESAWAALSASLEELRRMKAEGPSAPELAKARGFYAGSTPFNLQSVASLADSIATAELHGLGVSYVRDLAVRLAAVDVAQARAAAAAHLLPDDVIVVIVGKGAAVAPQLEKAGVTFERVDYRAPISGAARRAATPAPTPARPAP